MLPIKQMPQESYSQLEERYGDNMQEICDDHEKLIKKILEEEEDLISNHRQHIDDVVDIIKQDMTLLQNVEEPQSDIEDYVTSLDNMLLKKMEMISTVRSKLATFYTHLKKEESL